MEEEQMPRIGAVIKQLRKAKKLTQTELGERMGVKKSYVSILENDHCVITLPTMGRAFRALGVETATLDLGHLGKIELW